jgi:phospholipid/cholesterol/gamma-HCH transport system substrate-binding protein
VYVTYFDESVQGLQVDSEVKYRGVGVGNVKSIGVAPDQKLVEVVIKIALKGDVEHAVVTQLRAAGITGIVFVELDQRKPDDEVFLPSAKEVKTSYTIIPSKPSQTKQMLSGLDQLMERIAQVDLKGVTDQVKVTSRAMEKFVAGPEMNKILKNLDLTTAGLGSSLQRIDGILAEGVVQGTLAETRQGLEEARQGVAEMRLGLGETRRGIAETRELVAAVKEVIVKIKADELAGKADRLVEGLDRRTKKMAYEIESTTDDIRQAVEHLRALLDRLQQNPSDLIFSKPAGDKGEREAR